jgi:CheY-like chemotaxis protein
MSDTADEGIELWLPAADEAAIDVRMRSLEPGGQNLSKKGYVLVVDDDRAQRAAVRQALQSAGHVVVAAGSGVEALALARRLPTALLVVDFAMPGMSGIELVNFIRQDNPKLPVIFMSAQGNALDIQASVQAATIVAKPVDAGELLAAVRSMLGN